MTRKQREAHKWQTAKSDNRRQVFTAICSCRAPRVQLNVNLGTFCLGCWHPIAPKEQGRKKR